MSRRISNAEERRAHAEMNRLLAARRGLPPVSAVVDKNACTCGSRRMQAYLHTSYCAVRVRPNGRRAL